MINIRLVAISALISIFCLKHFSTLCVRTALSMHVENRLKSLIINNDSFFCIRNQLWLLGLMNWQRLKIGSWLFNNYSIASNRYFRVLNFFIIDFYYSLFSLIPTSSMMVCTLSNPFHQSRWQLEMWKLWGEYQHEALLTSHTADFCSSNSHHPK